MRRPQGFERTAPRRATWQISTASTSTSVPLEAQPNAWSIDYPTWTSPERRASAAVSAASRRGEL